MFFVKVFPENITKGFFELGSTDVTLEKSGEFIVTAPPKSPIFSLKVFEEKITGYFGLEI